MSDRLFLRRDTLSLAAILALPLLAGNLYVAGMIPDMMRSAVTLGLLPATFLDLELGRSVIYNGVNGIYILLIHDNGMSTPTNRLLWDIGVSLLITYTVAFVSIYLGMLLAATFDVVPNEPWRRAVVGTLVTVGMVSLVANATQWAMDPPLAGQTFHPEAVAGSLTLVTLAVVVLMLHQKTSVT